MGQGTASTSSIAPASRSRDKPMRCAGRRPACVLGTLAGAAFLIVLAVLIARNSPFGWMLLEWLLAGILLAPLVGHALRRAA